MKKYAIMALAAAALGLFGFGSTLAAPAADANQANTAAAPSADQSANTDAQGDTATSDHSAADNDADTD